METLINSNDWSKLFKMYYDIEVSVPFFDCVGTQLGEKFKKLTGIKINRPIMLWDQDTPPIIVIGSRSSMTTKLRAKFGVVDAAIEWSSKSGRTYVLSDRDIDCDDIDFDFQDFNVEKYKRHHRPDFSKFFRFYELTVDALSECTGMDVSAAFVKCMDEHLSKDFFVKTGIRPSIDISLGFRKGEFVYHPGVISTITPTLHINTNWHNDITINWRSKSDRIYSMSDEVIDCNDLEFWFDKLNPDLYYSELYPYGAPSLKIKNLTYDLTIKRLGIDCSLDMIVKSEKLSEVDAMLEAIYTFTNDFNEKSEKKNRSLGLVHNSRSSIENDVVTLDLDLGSAGIEFLKKLLTYIASLGIFKSVTVN